MRYHQVNVNNKIRYTNRSEKNSKGKQNLYAYRLLVIIASLVSIPHTVTCSYRTRSLHHNLTIDCLQTQNRRVAAQKTSAWEKIHCQPARIISLGQEGNCRVNCIPLLFGVARSADPMWGIFV